MDKLLEQFKKLWSKFLSLSKVIRILIVVALISTIVAIGIFVAKSMGDKYQILFSNLDPKDAQVVTAKLKEQKVDMKIQGETILVPKDKVDQLRLELAPDLSSGSQGYELMDSSSSFGMTDEEFKIKKIRMQQGELEKTIKSFPQVENARVHITPAKDSVFVQDKEPGKAAVTLKLAPGQKLEEEQVRSIVALISGSTDNIPKENVEVIDDKMNLLTAHINNKDEGSTGVTSETIASHQKLEKDYETKLESEITKLLEPVIGRGKVKASVAVDLDFDSKKKTETTIDPNKVIVSQQTNKEQGTSGGGTDSNSPVDNNMTNNIVDSNNGTTSLKEEQKTNYESGKTETTTISAPGEVRRMTTSVFIDGRLDAGTQEMLQDAIASAIGLNVERGDKVTVAGMEFDPLAKEEAQSEIDAMNALAKKEQMQRYILIGAIALGVIILGIIAFIMFRKKREQEEERTLDMVIGDEIEPKETISYKPIDFEVKNEKMHIESEIKNYAKEKPEQVADIIKAWLTENER